MIANFLVRKNMYIVGPAGELLLNKASNPSPHPTPLVLQQDGKLDIPQLVESVAAFAAICRAHHGVNHPVVHLY